jgi:hypothetical protein
MALGGLGSPAAKATRPEPAGKEMPIGNRVCESPPVPTVSGISMRLSHEWMIPSPGLSDTPPVTQRAHDNIQSKHQRRDQNGASDLIECVYSNHYC